MKSVVLDGKAPILRLQKLSERDVLDLSGSGDQNPDKLCVNLKGQNSSKTSISRFSASAINSGVKNETKTHDEDLTLEVANGEVEETIVKNVSSSSVAVSAIPDIEHDLLQLTSGFDD